MRHPTGLITMKLLTLILCMKLLFLLSVTAGPCPRQCNCHSSWLRGVTSVVVGCAKKKLTSIPTSRIPRYMTSFVLNENFITELPAFIFRRYRYLRELYLYKNFLTKIHKDAFRGLYRLKELSLHSNQIKRIENGTFRDLQNLRKLYLFTNFIEDINPNTFTGLKKVETVFLHENLLRFVPKDTFVPLEKLQILTLYRNYLRTLHTGSFNGLQSIRAIYLHENKIASIEKDAFRGSSKLKTLQLGNNLLINITNESFAGLSGLLELNLDNNRMVEINPTMFESIPRLKKLVLLGNRIEDLRAGTFENLRGLHLLSISGNNLTHLRPGMFAGLVELTRLFLQSNTIEWIEPFTFSGLINLQHLYLFRNKIYYIQEKTFFGLFSLSELNLGVNNITGLARGAFLGLPRLVSLQLNSNKLRMLTAGAFAKLRNLYRLVIYFNKIAYVDKNAFNGLNRLRHIVWYPPLALVRTSKILRTLKSNNLHCDCNVKHFKNWLRKQHIQSAIFCAKPTYLHRSNVTNLRDRYLKCDDIAIKIVPNYVLVSELTDVYLTCTTNIAANFTWTKNGKPIPSSYHTLQMTSGVLLLRKITKPRGGQYTCIVTSETGISAVSALVKIGTKPKIFGYVKDVVFIQKYKEDLVLNCVANGYPPPLNVWYRDGERLGSDDPRVFTSFNQSLLILRATAKDAGKYRCEAKNQLGIDIKVINVIYTKASSPCQPVCGTGTSCVMSFRCLAPNQTLQDCATKSTLNTKDVPDDSETSGDGSGDISVFSDDEDGDGVVDGDVSNNRIPIQTNGSPTAQPPQQVVQTNNRRTQPFMQAKPLPLQPPVPSHK